MASEGKGSISRVCHNNIRGIVRRVGNRRVRLTILGTQDPAYNIHRVCSNAFAKAGVGNTNVFTRTLVRGKVFIVSRRRLREGFFLGGGRRL